MSVVPPTPVTAYRPLRPRPLAAQLVALILAEFALLATYRGHEAGFHWATHFLVALAVVALLNLAWLLARDAPAPGQILSILAAHLVAMFPDFLFSAGIPHYPWMDVFLGHISAHEIPGERHRVVGDRRREPHRLRGRSLRVAPSRPAR